MFAGVLLIHYVLAPPQNTPQRVMQFSHTLYTNEHGRSICFQMYLSIVIAIKAFLETKTASNSIMRLVHVFMLQMIKLPVIIFHF